jgi:hypothetical protein
MPFPCPACDAPVDASPALPAMRCSACGAVLRSRAAGAADGAPAFDVEVVGRKDRRRRVAVPWDEGQRRLLRRWLLVSSGLTLGLVAVLYALARFAR